MSEKSAFPPILFLTSNENKFHEALPIMNKYGFQLIWKGIKKKEIQSDDVEAVALEAAKAAAMTESNPYVVEDDGLFIESLNGFPGPYSAYVLEKLGLDRLLSLIIDERTAFFKSAVALHLAGSFMVFTGVTHGTIAFNKRGNYGFGYDPIFIPYGSTKTLAEMAMEEKIVISHRGRAFSSLANYLKAYLLR